MNITITALVLALSIVLLHFLILQRRGAGNKLPLPPGPRPEPLIGNLQHVPSTASWLQYTTWKKVYGK
jgi:hypothetical protein